MIVFLSSVRVWALVQVWIGPWYSILYNPHPECTAATGEKTAKTWYMARKFVPKDKQSTRLCQSPDEAKVRRQTLVARVKRLIKNHFLLKFAHATDHQPPPAKNHARTCSVRKNKQKNKAKKKLTPEQKFYDVLERLSRFKKQNDTFRQNLQIKQAKHEAMSRLVAARENKDIAEILSMYQEHLGKLPDEFPASDYPKLTRIINRQIEKVKVEKEGIRFTHPTPKKSR
jgi:hypothetical protein